VYWIRRSISVTWSYSPESCIWQEAQRLQWDTHDLDDMWHMWLAQHAVRFLVYNLNQKTYQLYYGIVFVQLYWISLCMSYFLARQLITIGSILLSVFTELKALCVRACVRACIMYSHCGPHYKLWCHYTTLLHYYITLPLLLGYYRITCMVSAILFFVKPLILVVSTRLVIVFGFRISNVFFKKS